MRDLITFSVGLSVGLVIVLFSVKAERDSTTITLLKDKNVRLTEKVSVLEEKIFNTESENEQLKQSLSQTSRILKGF